MTDFCFDWDVNHQNKQTNEPHVQIAIAPMFFFRYALYDLLMAMLPYLSSDKIRQIYDIATDHIQVNTDPCKEFIIVDLTLNTPIATKDVCFSRLMKC